VGKPNPVGFGWMQNLILPNFKKKIAQFQKKLPNFKFGSQSYGCFTEPPLSYGFKGAVPTEKSGEAMMMQTSR
jgi:hypothetical protein